MGCFHCVRVPKRENFDFPNKSPSLPPLLTATTGDATSVLVWPTLSRDRLLRHVAILSRLFVAKKLQQAKSCAGRVPAAAHEGLTRAMRVEPHTDTKQHGQPKKHGLDNTTSARSLLDARQEMDRTKSRVLFERHCQLGEILQHALRDR